MIGQILSQPGWEREGGQGQLLPDVLTFPEPAEVCTGEVTGVPVSRWPNRAPAHTVRRSPWSPPTDPCPARKPNFLAGTQDRLLRAFFPQKALGLVQESLDGPSLHPGCQECADTPLVSQILRWDAPGPVLCCVPKLSSVTGPQSPTVVTCFITHPSLAALSSLPQFPSPYGCFPESPPEWMSYP